MKCPYAVHRLVKTTLDYEYDESGNVIKTIDETTNQAIFVNCLKEECGAWRDGRCKYKED